MLLNVVSNTTVQVTFAPMPTVIVVSLVRSAGTVSGGGAFCGRFFRESDCDSQQRLYLCKLD